MGMQTYVQTEGIDESAPAAALLKEELLLSRAVSFVIAPSLLKGLRLVSSSLDVPPSRLLEDAVPRRSSRTATLAAARTEALAEAVCSKCLLYSKGKAPWKAKADVQRDACAAKQQPPRSNFAGVLQHLKQQQEPHREAWVGAVQATVPAATQSAGKEGGGTMGRPEATSAPAATHRLRRGTSGNSLGSRRTLDASFSKCTKRLRHAGGSAEPEEAQGGGELQRAGRFSAVGDGGQQQEAGGGEFAGRSATTAAVAEDAASLSEDMCCRDTTRFCSRCLSWDSLQPVLASIPAEASAAAAAQQSAAAEPSSVAAAVQQSAAAEPFAAAVSTHKDGGGLGGQSQFRGVQLLQKKRWCGHTLRMIEVVKRRTGCRVAFPFNNHLPALSQSSWKRSSGSDFVQWRPNTLQVTFSPGKSGEVSDFLRRRGEANHVNARSRCIFSLQSCRGRLKGQMLSAAQHPVDALKRAVRA
ncbi:hypothetical protein cyc_05753 [Cyclospora cayetanensis]|uniref:Uncharacterized protein n=1 Tax=Cyclospora cayetanensis TaxID=88456 RepID=A0A1D3D4T9_9EIME|nr:hypothetical protein cyc_05753 [Cyclospora cayetanensis]